MPIVDGVHSTLCSFMLCALGCAVLHAASNSCSAARRTSSGDRGDFRALVALRAFRTRLVERRPSVCRGARIDAARDVSMSSGSLCLPAADSRSSTRCRGTRAGARAGPQVSHLGHAASARRGRGVCWSVFGVMLVRELGVAATRGALLTGRDIAATIAAYTMVDRVGSSTRAAHLFVLASRPVPDLSALVGCRAIRREVDGALRGRGWQYRLVHARPARATARRGPGPRGALVVGRDRNASRGPRSGRTRLPRPSGGSVLAFAGIALLAL